MLLLYFWDKTDILTSMFISNKQLQILPYLVGFSHDTLHIYLGVVFTIRSGMVKMVPFWAYPFTLIWVGQI